MVIQTWLFKHGYSNMVIVELLISAEQPLELNNFVNIIYIYIF